MSTYRTAKEKIKRTWSKGAIFLWTCVRLGSWQTPFQCCIIYIKTDYKNKNANLLRQTVILSYRGMIEDTWWNCNRGMREAWECSSQIMHQGFKEVMLWTWASIASSKIHGHVGVNHVGRTPYDSRRQCGGVQVGAARGKCGHHDSKWGHYNNLLKLSFRGGNSSSQGMNWCSTPWKGN